MANKYNRQKIDIKKVIQLYELGLTQIEIAKQINTSQKVIHQRLKEIGYKCRIAKKRNQLGSNNSSWKGDKACYAALHYRVEKARGKPKLCIKCGSTTAKRFEWANITGKYWDINDYVRLCKSCHAKLHEVYKNFYCGGGDE